MSASPYELFSLNKKVILVTGASRGIGQSIAAGLHKAEATVYGLARSQPHQIQGSGYHYRACDVTDASQLQSVLDEIIEKEKRIDVLINTAGITKSMDVDDLESCTEVFDQTLNINLRACYLSILLASQYMKRQESGSIINFTSIAAERGFANNPSYVASKGGLKMMTKAFAEDLAPFGIRVNSVAPGYIHTDMTDKSYQNPHDYEVRNRNTMLKRWGEPQDLLGAVIFLASEASSYVTGTDLVVDGGWLAKGMV